MRFAASAEDVALARQDDGSLQVAATLRNQGDLHVFASGKAKIVNARGLVVAAATFPGKTGLVMPGYARRFEALVGSRLPDGVYVVQAEFTMGKGTPLAAASETFTLANHRITKGRPSPEQEAILLASVPRLALSRSRAHYELAPGAQRVDRVLVRNVSNETVTVIPRLLFWDLDANADLCFGEQDSRHGRAATNLVSFSPSEIALSPGGQGAVVYTIRLPRDAVGEFYPALVLAERGLPLPRDPKVLRQQALVISVAAKGRTKRTAEIRDVRFRPDRAGAGVLRVTVKCTGNAGVEIEGKVDLATSGGKRVSDPRQFGGQGVLLLPGTQATFDVEVPFALPSGTYTATVTLRSVAGGHSLATATSHFQVGRPQTRSAKGSSG